MKNWMRFLLGAIGIGGAGFILYSLLKPKTVAAPASPTATTNSAGQLDAIYKGLGSLFGANKTTDNTGQLITSAGTAATGLFNSIKSLWPTSGTPVSSPAAGDLTPPTTAGFDPNNTN
jgi:hypothetical protein